VLLQGLTAHYLCCDTYPCKPDDLVVVHAGAGGTGGLLIQMCKLRGARVVATASSDEKRQICLDLGADWALPYEGFGAFVRERGGAHAIYDGVGAATFDEGLNSLRRRGYYVAFGNASGKIPPVDPLRLSKAGSVYLTRPTLLDFTVTAEELQQRCNDVLGWVANKQLKVRVAASFPLEQVAQAHDFLESRKALGKIIVSIADF